MKTRLVCATRLSEEDFFQHTALGKSYRLYRAVMPELEIMLFAGNTQGLPLVYNHAIDASASDPAILVFVHDDVHLNDFYWSVRVGLWLDRFDVVGVVGNTRRLPRQASWLIVDASLTPDDKQYLSGIFAYGNGFPPIEINPFGNQSQECKLLDGFFLAVRSQTLLNSGLRFDPRFDFHFYDMDFCRQAELLGLKMGTCPISLVHESLGQHEKAWHQAYQVYLQKYGE